MSLSIAAIGSSSAAAQAPVIESESVTDIKTSSAVLRARINTNGLLTVYKLQIDTTGNFKFDQNDSCALHPPGTVCAQVMVEGEPLPEGLVEPPESTLPGSTEGQHVSVLMNHLQPGTTYHFRAIAANSFNFIYGPDLTFTTPTEETAEGVPPVLFEIQPPPPDDEEPPPVEEEEPQVEERAEAPIEEGKPLGEGESGAGSKPNEGASPVSGQALQRSAKAANRRKHHRRYRRGSSLSLRAMVHDNQAVG